MRKQETKIDSPPIKRLIYFSLALTVFIICWILVELLGFQEADQGQNYSKAFRVSGSSMSPQLRSGDIVWLQTNVELGHIKRGDIVAVQPLKRRNPLIKKVVGLPRDEFSIDLQSGLIFINGTAVKNSADIPYVFTSEKRKVLLHLQSTFNGKIPEGAFLVFGDNPKGSLDSEIFGFVDIEEIIGVVSDH